MESSEGILRYFPAAYHRPPTIQRFLYGKYQRACTEQRNSCDNSALFKRPIGFAQENIFIRAIDKQAADF